MPTPESKTMSASVRLKELRLQTTNGDPPFELILKTSEMDAETEKQANIQKAMQWRPVASWASLFLDYVDLKARLMAVETKEASGHFFGLVILLGIILVLAVSSVLMYGAFLLYLVSLIFHLAWGWSALICGAILTLSNLVGFLLLRMRLRKPVFQLTLKDLEKDKEWLTQSKTKAS
jgi:uncharacterized membrane protein YqjE